MESAEWIMENGQPRKGRGELHPGHETAYSRISAIPGLGGVCAVSVGAWRVGGRARYPVLTHLVNTVSIWGMMSF